MTTKFNYTARQALCFAHRIHDDGTSSLVRACACLLAATRPTAMSMHTPRFTNRSASSRPLQPLHLNFDEQCDQNTKSTKRSRTKPKSVYLTFSVRSTVVRSCSYSKQMTNAPEIRYGYQPARQRLDQIIANK